MSTYILQKDLPGIKAGAEFSKRDATNKFYYECGVSFKDAIPIPDGMVELCPDWFKLKKESFKIYVLQKDLPNVKAGAELIESKFEGCNIYRFWPSLDFPVIFGKNEVENNPEWFKLKEEKPMFKEWDEVIENLTGIKDFMSNHYTLEDMRNCFSYSYLHAKENKYAKSSTLFEDYIKSIS